VCWGGGGLVHFCSETVANNSDNLKYEYLVDCAKEDGADLALERIPHILQQHKWHGGQIPG
jgi:hypothetical protein